MIANDMKYGFLQKLDKDFQYGAPAYDDVGISNWLTKGELAVFKKYYKPGDDGFSFEDSEYTGKALQELIRSASISGNTIVESSNQVGVHPNGTFYDLPTDFYLVIEEGAKTGDDVNNEACVRPMSHDAYFINRDNPYKKPSPYVVWRMNFSRVDHGEDGGDALTDRTNKRIELIVRDKSTKPITDYRVRYLRYPPAIVCDEFTPSNQRHCILDEGLHDEIINEAVKMATAAVKPEEYQIAAIENKEN
jgi:hypothetical protein